MFVIIAQYVLKDAYMRFMVPKNIHGVATRYMMVFYYKKAKKSYGKTDLGSKISFARRHCTTIDASTR